MDHGKSTLIGRLLADTGALPDGKLAQVKATCERNARPFEYAFLLDALKDEQAQGITIDTARCFFKSKKREYIIIDAPGHIAPGRIGIQIHDLARLHYYRSLHESVGVSGKGGIDRDYVFAGFKKG